MPLTAQDIEALSGIFERVAKAACSEAMVPVQRELAEVRGMLALGGVTMKQHRGEIDEHEDRLDGHDGEIAKLKPRLRSEVTPSSGAAIIVRRRRFADLLAVEAVQKYGPALVLLTIGSMLPYFGRALIALGEWISRVSQAAT